MKHNIFPNTEIIDFSKKLKIKFGIDPTSDKLHLGHLIPLRVAKELWEQGHHVDIVLGTFTAQLGDPSGKDTMRPIMSSEETEKNAESIIEQIARIFGDINASHPGWNRIQISRNGEWFGAMNAVMMTTILSNFTTTQLLSRDSFQKRMQDKNPIGMHELVVPVLQGYDSVILKTDVEIGGTDQLFNFGITRDMQRIKGQQPEKCILMPIINGTDGRKMSKSFGNCIFLNDTPEDVFGKVMSISDALMKEWWPVITDSAFPTPDPMGRDMAEDLHPMKLKKDLAWFVTNIIWGHEKAKLAHEHFEGVIQSNELPDVIEEIIITDDITILNIIMKIRNCSKSEARRLIESKAVKLVFKYTEPITITNETKLFIEPGIIIKVGKRDFAKLI